jgi:predicted metal-binding membrane protein
VLFVAAYLGVWTAVGLLVHAVDRPHGTAVAGALCVAAGLYELTPLKRECRRRCRAGTGSGIGFGLWCVGSTVGLMAVLIAVGLMSVAWMAVIAALAVAQKLLPPRASLDALLAAAPTAVGILALVAPSAVPGLTPAM